MATKRSKGDLWREIGNVLTQWEMLPNDLRSDPSFDSLDGALKKLYEVTQAERQLQERGERTWRFIC